MTFNLFMSMILACRRETITLTCAVDEDNALRLDCTATREIPGPVELSVVPASGGDERVFVSGEEASIHTFHVQILRPQTRYHIAATDQTGASAEGEWRTGALPPEFPRATVSGAPPSSDEGVLFLMSCAGPYAFQMDAEGVLVWYQDLAEGLTDSYSHVARALTRDADGEISVLLDQSIVRRFSARGERLFHVDIREHGLVRALHHDLVRKGDLIYLLFADRYAFDEQLYVLDGLYLLDANDGTPLAEWELADHIVPEGLHGQPGYWDLRFPNADDWSHANGLFVDDAYGVWTSWYQLDAVTRIDGDPDSANFGSMTLAIAGDARSPFVPGVPTADGGAVLSVTDPDALTSDETFSFAHHPNLVSYEGRAVLTLFDNEQSTMSRVLALELDETREVAEIAGSWEVGAHCPVEGSVYPLSSGHWLATCPAGPALVEISPLSGEIVRTTTLSCGSGGAKGLVPRAIPVPLDF